MKTPILLIIFNRADTVQKVFQAIREVKPERLYVACDAPRANIEGETQKCNEAKNIITMVDWDCQVKTMFLTHNQGPKDAPYQFIKWFFENETEGIILEHDCLPSSDFFGYCQELLERFRDDDRIGIISGTNFTPQSSQQKSYHASKYTHIWGWASWRRTIQKYDLELNIDDPKELINSTFVSKSERNYWTTILQQLNRNELMTWDYFLAFSIWKHKMVNIIPSRNLVSNIGFGELALNTTDLNSPMANMKRESIMPLQHSQLVPYESVREVKCSDDDAFFRQIIMSGKGTVRFYVKILLKRLGVFDALLKMKR